MKNPKYVISYPNSKKLSFGGHTMSPWTGYSLELIQTENGFISADNRIPFFIPSLLSGVGTILLLWLFLSVINLGIWGMVLAPGIAQLVYQNWKWPTMVIKELNII